MFTIIIWACHIFQFMVFSMVGNLLFHQMVMIASDKTYYEITKAPDTEGSFLCFKGRLKPEESKVSSCITF
jgi:hypothetical protein